MAGVIDHNGYARFGATPIAHAHHLAILPDSEEQHIACAFELAGIHHRDPAKVQRAVASPEFAQSDSAILDREIPVTPR